MSAPLIEDDVVTDEVLTTVDVVEEGTASSGPSYVPSTDVFTSEPVAEAARVIAPMIAPSLASAGTVVKPIISMKNVFASVVENVDHTSTSTKERAVYFKINVVATYYIEKPTYIDEHGDLVEPGAPEETNVQWFVYHRFSDFDLLHSFLVSQSNTLPSLPPKTWWWTSVSEEMLVKRRVELNDYLMKMLEIPFVRNSVELIQFLEIEKYANIDTSGVPRPVSTVADRNFGVNTHIYDGVDGLLFTACEESDRMARLDSHLSNMRLPWQKNVGYKVPLGSVNVWKEDKDQDIWSPVSTLFFEQQASAIAFDRKRMLIWVGLHSGLLLGFRLNAEMTEFTLVYELHMHNQRVTQLLYVEDDDILFTIGRDSTVGLVRFGREHALKLDREVPGTYTHRDVVSYHHIGTNENWSGTMSYDKDLKLLYVGTYSGKIIVYHVVPKALTQEPGNIGAFINNLTTPNEPLPNGFIFSAPTEEINIASPYTLMFPSSTKLDMVHILTAHTDAIRSMCFNAEQQCLVTSGFDAKTGVWELQGVTDRENLNLKNTQINNIGWFKGGPRERIKSVCLCSNINSIIVGLDNGMLAVWDTLTAELVYILQAHGNSIVALEWIPERHMLISSGRDGKVQFWTISPRN